MRFIMAFIVSIILMQMAFYVLANMAGATYSFTTATVVGIIFAILAMLIGKVTVSESDA